MFKKVWLIKTLLFRLWIWYLNTKVWSKILSRSKLRLNTDFCSNWNIARSLENWSFQQSVKVCEQRKTAPLFRTQRQTRFLLCPSFNLGNWQSVESPQKISSNSLLLKLYDQNITKKEISQIRVNSTQVWIMCICCPSVTENPKLEIFSLSRWSPLRAFLLNKLFWRLFFSFFSASFLRTSFSKPKDNFSLQVS